MIKSIRLFRRVLGISLLVGLGILAGASQVGAQAPFSAQIQAALRVFLTTAHTWTGVQTYSGTQTFTGQIFLPDGTAPLPAIAFTSDTTLGFRRTSSSTVYISKNASATAFGVGPADANSTLQINGGGSPAGIRGGVNIGFYVGAANESNAMDTGLTRISAGLFGVGTGTLGSFAGGIKLTTLNIAGTDVSTAATGVALGYKVARGSTAFDGSNPTTVATGLTSVISCTGTLRVTAAFNAGGSAFVTHAAPSGANVDFYAWLVTGAASTNTETFEWICVGT